MESVECRGKCEMGSGELRREKQGKERRGPKGGEQRTGEKVRGLRRKLNESRQ